MKCYEKIVLIALLLAQMFFFFYLILSIVQYLFFYLNEIPGFHTRHCSEATSKPKSISQKALVLIRILSLNTANLWEDTDHQYYMKDGRMAEAAHRQ